MFMIPVTMGFEPWISYMQCSYLTHWTVRFMDFMLNVFGKCYMACNGPTVQTLSWLLEFLVCNKLGAQQC